jgi:hypothetical protein
MFATETYRRLNRHGASSIFAILFLGAISFAHFMARTRMDICHRQFALMYSRTIHEMALIDFIDSHFWLVFAYAVLYVASLLWLEIRSAPRWTIWLTFVLLAVPTMVYARAALHIGNKLIDWTATDRTCVVSTFVALSGYAEQRSSRSSASEQQFETKIRGHPESPRNFDDGSNSDVFDPGNHPKGASF